MTGLRTRGPQTAWCACAGLLRRARRDDRGESVLELMMWGAALTLTMLLGVYAFRLSGAQGEVRDAAQAGARAASLARSPGEALGAGRSAALATLPVGDEVCRTASVTVDTSRWNTGWVVVTVDCAASMSGLAPGTAPASRAVIESWTEPVDQGRRRTGP